MPRKLRLEYEGAIYHVMNRGDRREAIFLDDLDRKRFLETLAEACEKTVKGQLMRMSFLEKWRTGPFPRLGYIGQDSSGWLSFNEIFEIFGKVNQLPFSSDFHHLNLLQVGAWPAHQYLEHNHLKILVLLINNLHTRELAKRRHGIRNSFVYGRTESARL